MKHIYSTKDGSWQKEVKRLKAKKIKKAKQSKAKKSKVPQLRNKQSLDNLVTKAFNDLISGKL